MKCFTCFNKQKFPLIFNVKNTLPTILAFKYFKLGNFKNRKDQPGGLQYINFSPLINYQYIENEPKLNVLFSINIHFSLPKI